MKKHIFCLVLFFASASLMAAEPIGWRTDGSGRYPDTTPPTTWSETENVVWKTLMPGKGFGSPIILGEQIFVASEPAELICMNSADGKTQWQASASIIDLLGDEGTKIVDFYKQLEQQEELLHDQYRKLDKDSKEREAIKAKSAQFKSQMQEMRRRHPIGGGRAGNTAGTPTSDGQRVFVAYGSGIVAGYSVDGEQLWMRFVEGSRLNFGHSSSPLLVGDKLIVHYQDLVALDAETGNEIWRVEAKARHATPIATTIGDEVVVITPAGNVLRASDGKEIGKVGMNTSECTPVLHDGILFAHQNGSVSAFEIPKQTGDELEFELLWKATGARDRRTPSGVYHDGLLYGVTTSGIMEVLDAESGEVVYKKRLGMKRVYSSVTAAGDHLFICGTGGEMLVLETGSEYKEVARNKLEGCGSCPVFVGKRMYLRGQEHLYCIGS